MLRNGTPWANPTSKWIELFLLASYVDSLWKMLSTSPKTLFQASPIFIYLFLNFYFLNNEKKKSKALPYSCFRYTPYTHSNILFNSTLNQHNNKPIFIIN